MRTSLKVQVVALTAIHVLVASSNSQAEIIYTSLKLDKCWKPEKQVVVQYDAQSLEVQECKAPTDWRFFIVSTTERSWVDLQHGQDIWTTQEQVLSDNDFGYFPNVGDGVVEWNVASSKKPLFAIFRVYAQDKNIPPWEDAVVSRLFVIDLRQTPPGFCGTAKTNDGARTLTNRAEKCGKPLSRRLFLTPK